MAVGEVVGAAPRRVVRRPATAAAGEARGTGVAVSAPRDELVALLHGLLQLDHATHEAAVARRAEAAGGDLHVGALIGARAAHVPAEAQRRGRCFCRRRGWWLAAGTWPQGSGRHAARRVAEARRGSAEGRCCCRQERGWWLAVGGATAQPRAHLRVAPASSTGSMTPPPERKFSA